MTPLELFEEYQTLAYYILKKYYPTYYYSDQLSEDMCQVAALGLWKACISYDSSRSTAFTTYAGKCILNELKMELRYTDNHYIETVSFDARVKGTHSIDLEDMLEDNSAQEEIEYRMLIADIERGLKPKDREFFEKLSHMTTKQIQDELGISRQAVIAHRDRVYKKIKKLGILD